MPEDNRSGANRMEESEMAMVKKMLRGLQGAIFKNRGPLEEPFSCCSFLSYWLLKSSLIFGVNVYLSGPPSEPRSFLSQAMSSEPGDFCVRIHRDDSLQMNKQG